METQQNSDASLPPELVRRIREVVASRRTVTALSSIVVPTVVTLAIGVSGTLVNVVAALMMAPPWVAASRTAAQMGLFAFCAVVFPLLYFFLAGRLGIGYGAFRLYSAYRDLIAEVVIDRVMMLRREPQSEPTAGRGFVAQGSDAMRGLPRVARWIIKLVLMLIGAGDRLQDAIEQLADEHPDERPDVMVVAAIVDDLLVARLCEPPQRYLLIAAMVNVAALAGLWFARANQL